MDYVNLVRGHGRLLVGFEGVGGVAFWVEPPNINKELFISESTKRGGVRALADLLHERRPPKFTAKQLAVNRRRAAKALADWNAGTGQYSQSSDDDERSKSHSLQGTGGDPGVPSPIPDCTATEKAKANSGTGAGPSVGTSPLVPNTISTEEDDTSGNSPTLQFKRFRGFERVRVTDTYADCMQDGEAVERHRTSGPDSQDVQPSGFGVHVAGHETPELSVEVTDLDSSSDGDPNETQKRRQEDEDLHPPSGSGLFHRSGRVGFGMLYPNTQCPSLSPDDGLTPFPGLSTTCTPLDRGTSMERGAPRTRSTPPSHGDTQSTVARSTDATMRTTNADVRPKVTSTPRSGATRPPHTPRTTPLSSRDVSNRNGNTPIGVLGVAAPPTNSIATTVTRTSPFSTTPTITTNITPWSYRPFTTTIRRTSTSTYSTKNATPPLHYIPPGTTTCTPPSTEAIGNVQASTPLTPLNPNTFRAAPYTETSEISRGVLRTPFACRKENPTAPALRTRTHRRRATTHTPPRNPVCSRAPPTTPSSPIISTAPPSQATFMSPPSVIAPQVQTPGTNRGTPTAGAQINGSAVGPRRSQRNVPGLIPTQGCQAAGLQDNFLPDDNTPPTSSYQVNRKRLRKDMNAEELAEVREREKMRKRQQRAQSRLLSFVPLRGNGAGGSISMRWRPVIKLFEGIPVGECQQQLVRALSRFLPAMIPCYRHARSLTDAELARIHIELQSRYENGTELLPTWTRRACGSLLLSHRMRVRNLVRDHLLNLANSPHGAIEPPAGVLQCELNYFVQELASDEFQRRSERMAAISRAMVAVRGCGNTMGAGGVDRARALYTLREGKPPTIKEVQAWKEKCMKTYKNGNSKTALELRLQDPGPVDSDDHNSSDEDKEDATWGSDETSYDFEESDAGSSSVGDEVLPSEIGDGTSDPDWHHPFLGPTAFYRRYVFLYGKDPTSEELQAWLSSGRPPLPHGK